MVGFTEAKARITYAIPSSMRSFSPKLHRGAPLHVDVTVSGTILTDIRSA